LHTKVDAAAVRYGTVQVAPPKTRIRKSLIRNSLPERGGVELRQGSLHGCHNPPSQSISFVKTRPAGYGFKSGKPIERMGLSDDRQPLSASNPNAPAWRS